MKTVTHDLMRAKELIEGERQNKNSFIDYSPIFRQTNEPFERYLKPEIINGKDVLTVAGSGDFLISVLASNPTSTTTFDINKLTRYYQELKIGALLTLNMEEFLEFFYGDNPLDSKYLNRVMRVVSKEVQEFWGELVNTFGCNLILSNLFMKSKATKENAIKYNDFLKSPKAYNHAKRALIYHAYAFHHLDFNDLGTLKKKFDTIFLSGILDYQNCGIEAMVAIMKEKTKDILKPNGIVIASTFKGSYLEENVYKDTYTLEKVSGTIASIKIK